MNSNAVRFWLAATLGFLIIIGLFGFYMSVPLQMMGRSFADRGTSYHEPILFSAFVVFPVVINVWWGIMAYLD